MTGLLGLLGLLLVGMGMDAFSNDDTVSSPDPSPGPEPAGGAIASEGSGDILDGGEAQPDNPGGVAVANASAGESEGDGVAKVGMPGELLNEDEAANFSEEGNADEHAPDNEIANHPVADNATGEMESPRGSVDVGRGDESSIGELRIGEWIDAPDNSQLDTSSGGSGATEPASVRFTDNGYAPVPPENGGSETDSSIAPEAGTLWATDPEGADPRDPVIVEEFDAAEDVLAVFIGDSSTAAGEVTLSDADNGDVLVALDAQVVMRVVGGQGSVTADMVRQVEGTPPLLG